MNPLDDLEFNDLLNKINTKMPIYTDRVAHMELSFSQRFPKNLMDYSTKLDNKFLNNNLGIIEEINHRNPKHWIPKWFQEYQNRIYGGDDILNKDNFFKAKLHDSFLHYQDEFGMPKNTKYYSGLTIKDVAFLGILKQHVNGTEFVTNVGSTGHTPLGADILWASLASSGVTQNAYYDEIAASCFDSIGNVALGCYLADGAGSIPATLVASNSGNACNSAYTYRSVTEFQITTTTAWLVLNLSSGSTEINFQNGGSVNYKTSISYPTISSPFPSTPSTSVNEMQQKCSHS